MFVDPIYCRLLNLNESRRFADRPDQTFLFLMLRATKGVKKCFRIFILFFDKLKELLNKLFNVLLIVDNCFELHHNYAVYQHDY